MSCFLTGAWIDLQYLNNTDNNGGNGIIVYNNRLIVENIQERGGALFSGEDFFLIRANIQ